MTQQFVLVEITSEAGLESLLRNPQVRVVGIVSDLAAARQTTSEAGQWTTVGPPPSEVPAPSNTPAA